ncbi:hypothetical protein NEMBOFW57_000473 [Staphylotrichum longicolle]|uniref:Uncharacterized protein n=1 Tax=Staphylotrichum longicolle TaxID=669026 RepID=A0AAD4EZF4_9PEZI|nr:hypothetical protein NEMBOFW57_000473 [Staphylotrichum longicolle]
MSLPADCPSRDSAATAKPRPLSGVFARITSSSARQREKDSPEPSPTARPARAASIRQPSTSTRPATSGAAGPAAVSRPTTSSGIPSSRRAVSGAITGQGSISAAGPGTGPAPGPRHARAKSSLPANVALSAETARLQTELLQLSLLHRRAHHVLGEWAGDARAKLRGRWDALDAAWKGECAALARRLDEWRRKLRELGDVPAPAPAPGPGPASAVAGGDGDGVEAEASALARILGGCRALVHGMLEELEVMEQIEREAAAAEMRWVREMNRKGLGARDEDGRRAGAIWRAF